MSKSGSSETLGPVLTNPPGRHAESRSANCNPLASADAVRPKPRPASQRYSRPCLSGVAAGVKTLWLAVDVDPALGAGDAVGNSNSGRVGPPGQRRRAGRIRGPPERLLNDFIGSSTFEVSVIPVTAVIAEVRYGAREQERVDHRGSPLPKEPASGALPRLPNWRTFL